MSYIYLSSHVHDVHLLLLVPLGQVGHHGRQEGVEVGPESARLVLDVDLQLRDPVELGGCKKPDKSFRTRFRSDT